MQQLSKKGYYNPFLFIHNDADIEILVKTLISNTDPPDQHDIDLFWKGQETTLLVALIAYLYHYCPPSQQTFTNVINLIRAAEIREDDSTYSSSLDAMFQQIEEIEPESFAVRQYKNFKRCDAKTLRSILISCEGRLQALA